MVKGYLSLVLHAHLPYIRHPEKQWSLEENWFFEAMTETYVPLVNTLERLIDDGVDFRITISLSPALISMMSDELLQNRYLNRLNQLIELAGFETGRTKGTEFELLARMYLHRLTEVRDAFVMRYEKDILRVFRRLFETGKIELITCCATHGYLPLMVTRESVRAQVGVAVEIFARYFESPLRGIWLPECGYAPGVDEVLEEFGIRYFFTDSHGITFATPAPKTGVYNPLVTPNGVAVFGRDQETSRQVWDKHQGYPGDPSYREFYRDIGYDLDLKYINPYIGENGLRIDTGLKYFRITGTHAKQVYDPEKAERRAAEHAENFVANRVKQLEHLSSGAENPPIITAPYDAELFGHWWYEGPQWLACVLRKMHYDQNTVKTITPLEYLQRYPVTQVGLPSDSSWGHNGYNEMWLDSSNAWIYRHTNKAEERMVHSAAANPNSSGLTRRALNQMARELLLAQSSDWAFIIRNGTTVEYARKRISDHVSRFNRLYWAVKNNELNNEEISRLEQLDPIFPELDYSIYQPKLSTKAAAALKKLSSSSRKISVLMLSWEFPPRTVGGLSRHVYDLSRALAERGVQVHVITCHVPGTDFDETVDGVFVHRVLSPPEGTKGFVEWIEQLNMAMIERAEQLLEAGSFDIIHAHDWLSAQAGITLKNSYKIPLVSTIHATEYGRNHGIHNDIQRQINRIEWKLTFESRKVICCSKYMASELSQIFQLPGDKIRIIANGVEISNIISETENTGFREQYASPFEKIVYFVGRLVPEKGVQVLIEAVPRVIARCPEAKFVVSGVGGYRDFLVAKARELGVLHKVFFTGFTDDSTRNMLLASSDTAVFPSLYEPFGIVALEAMAAKVPVIVSDTGGLSEVIEHETDGLKVIPNDAHQLAEAITRILSDRGHADRMKKAAWDKVNSVYNWSVIAEATVSVYGEVLDESYTNGFILRMTKSGRRVAQ